MALGSTGQGTRGGRRSRRSRRAALSEINVTPLVDVMLVLLIIFMISAPLLTSGIKLTLPRTEAAALKDQDKPLTISVTKDGGIYVMDAQASFDQLKPRLLAITNNDTSKPVYVRAEGAAPYESVAKVMARLQTSGFVKINLLTDPAGSRSGAGAASVTTKSAGTGGLK